MQLEVSDTSSTSFKNTYLFKATTKSKLEGKRKKMLSSKVTQSVKDSLHMHISIRDIKLLSRISGKMLHAIQLQIFQDIKICFVQSKIFSKRILIAGSNNRLLHTNCSTAWAWILVIISSSLKKLLSSVLITLPLPKSKSYRNTSQDESV